MCGWACITYARTYARAHANLKVDYVEQMNHTWDMKPMFPTGPDKKPPPLPAKADAVKVEVVKRFATKLEPHMIPVAERAIEMGMPMKSVAGLLGVHKATFTRWLEMGMAEGQQDELLVEFAVRLEQARQKAILGGVQNLQLHAMRDWRAQKALLEALDPEVWVTRQHVTQDINVTKGEEEDLSSLTDEELEMRRQIEEKVRKKPRLGA